MGVSELSSKLIGDKVQGGAWLPRLKEMIPSYGQSLIDDAELCRRVRAETAAVLNIFDLSQETVSH